MSTRLTTIMMFEKKSMGLICDDGVEGRLWRSDQMGDL